MDGARGTACIYTPPPRGERPGSDRSGTSDSDLLMEMLIGPLNQEFRDLSYNQILTY